MLRPDGCDEIQSVGLHAHMENLVNAYPFESAEKSVYLMGLLQCTVSSFFQSS